MAAKKKAATKKSPAKKKAAGNPQWGPGDFGIFAKLDKKAYTGSQRDVNKRLKDIKNAVHSVLNEHLPKALPGIDAPATHVVNAIVKTPGG